MSEGFEVQSAARAKREQYEDAPSQESMRPSGIRNAPSTDQKRVRRAMTRGMKKSAHDEHTGTTPDQTSTISKENSMSHPRHSEADMLRAMAKATPAEQVRLMADLEELRGQRTAARQDERDLDLSSQIVAAHMTPVHTYGGNSATTDWLHTVATSTGDNATQDMKAEASLWFSRLAAGVVEDKEEFTEQAQGMARRKAGKYGENMDTARRAFLDVAAHLHRQAKATDGPDKDSQSGHAESGEADYEGLAPVTEGTAFGEGWAGDTGDAGVHPDPPGAKASSKTAAIEWWGNDQMGYDAQVDDIRMEVIAPGHGSDDYYWQASQDYGGGTEGTANTLAEAKAAAEDGREALIEDSGGVKPERYGSRKTAAVPKRVIAIYPDKRVEETTVSGLKDMQAIVGGYIEAIDLKDGVSMFADEEGRINGAEFNSIATDVAGLGGRTDLLMAGISGPVFLIGQPDQHGNSTHVPKAAKGWVQRVAREASVKQGSRRTAAATTTWANGFGNWFAEVDDTEDSAQVALDAIIDELDQRLAPNFDPSAVGVALVNPASIGEQPAPGRVIYEEIGVEDGDYNEYGSHVGSRRTADGPDKDSQSGHAESDVDQVEVGDNDDSLFPWEMDENTPGTGAADVADVPTPGGEAGYPQPKGASRKRAANGCACARNSDGTTTTMLCPVHADEDPCWTKASVTGQRRKGSIVRGTCTNCGWTTGTTASRRTAVNDTDISEDQAREFLSAPSGSRPRIYGVIDGGDSDGQITAIRSAQNLDRFDYSRIWLSGTTVQDLVSRASLNPVTAAFKARVQANMGKTASASIQFKLNIDSGNAGMMDGDENFDTDNLADLIDGVAGDLENGNTSGYVRDYNGNSVGSWTLGTTRRSSKTASHGTFTMTFDSGNAGVLNDDGDAPDTYAIAELVSSVAADVRGGRSSGRVMDYNGNGIGSWDLKIQRGASRKARRTASLSNKMDFGHVVQVHADGSVTDANGQYAPDVYRETDEGQYLDTDDDVQRQVRGSGWELLTGFTGQYGYNGIGMHASEFIGGGLERHILANPGFYAAIYPSTDDPDGPDEWYVAFKRGN